MSCASIVIPVFNRAHLVHRAIDSALAQTYPCEVVLVDHGSTDDIASVVRHYDGRIRYVRRDHDQGPIACWRDGLEQATGDVVHITYDDDWLAPTFMERALSLLHHDVGLVYTRALLCFADDGHEEPSLTHPGGVRPVSQLVEYLLRSPYTISPGCAIFRRRDALTNLLPEIPEACGRYGPNTGVGEDLLLFLLTTLQYPRYAHVPEPLAFFFAHRGSITIGAVSSDKARDLAAAYARAKDYYLQQPGALAPLAGFRAFNERARWVLAAGSIARRSLHLFRGFRP